MLKGKLIARYTLTVCQIVKTNDCGCLLYLKRSKFRFRNKHWTIKTWKFSTGKSILERVVSARWFSPNCLTRRKLREILIYKRSCRNKFKLIWRYFTSRNITMTMSFKPIQTISSRCSWCKYTLQQDRWGLIAFSVRLERSMLFPISEYKYFHLCIQSTRDSGTR